MEYEEEYMEDPIEVDDDGDGEEYEVQSVEVLSGILLKNLTRVPLGKGLADHIQDLKERPSGWEVYAKEMSYPQKIVEHILSRLELEGSRVEVMEYATKENVQILLDSLSEFDLDLSVNYHTKYQLQKMPIIYAFLTSLEHCRITEFTFELSMCGNEECTIYARIK